MRVGVIGMGVVGGAAYKSLSDKNVDVIGYDKYKNIGKFADILSTNIVFLCLPTLYNMEIHEYDKSAIIETCTLLVENGYQGLVVVKSTVEPTTSQNLADKYKLHIVHNPEFLTARTACEDFHNQQHIIIGKTSTCGAHQVTKLVNFYTQYYPQAEITLCESQESESIKIFCNCFYAVKVQFFNELYLLCDKLKLDYAKIKNAMLKNGWINPMHTDVPGPDGKLSYGGMCFPKDTNALLSFMESQNTPHAVLKATVEEHNIMRDE